MYGVFVGVGLVVMYFIVNGGRDDGLFYGVIFELIFFFV